MYIRFVAHIMLKPLQILQFQVSCLPLSSTPNECFALSRSLDDYIMLPQTMCTSSIYLKQQST